MTEPIHTPTAIPGHLPTETTAPSFDQPAWTIDDIDDEDDWPADTERTEVEWLTEVTESWSALFPTAKLRTLLGLAPDAPVTVDDLINGKDRLDGLVARHERSGDAIEFDVGEHDHPPSSFHPGRMALRQRRPPPTRGSRGRPMNTSNTRQVERWIYAGLRLSDKRKCRA
jgi:hypothetical protein